MNEDIACYILKDTVQLSSLKRRELIFFPNTDSSQVSFYVLICIHVELREVSDTRHIKAILSSDCFCPQKKKSRMFCCLFVLHLISSAYSDFIHSGIYLRLMINSLVYFCSVWLITAPKWTYIASDLKKGGQENINHVLKLLLSLAVTWIVQVKWKDKYKPELVVWLRNLALCASDGQGDLRWVFMLRQRGKSLSSVEDFV